jgi:hypothetical protein
MSLDESTSLDIQVSAQPSSPPGTLRRFFAGWRRFEDAMDYNPYDYTNDRIRGLELRIEQLEQRLAAAPSDQSATNPSSTVFPSSSGQR